MPKSFEAEALSVQMTVSPAAVVTDPESYDRGYEAGMQAGGGGGVTPEQIESAVNKYLEEHPLTETDPTIYPWAKEPAKPKYTADEVGTYSKDKIDGDFRTIDESISKIALTAEMAQESVIGFSKQLMEESHFRGYLSTNAKVQALSATPNDFAYSAESGTKWVYDAKEGWQNTGTPVPDQLTPASDTTPLMNGEASKGQEEAYARGDHIHPHDVTKVDKAEFNELKADIEMVLDELHNYSQALIGGAS